MSTSLEKTLQAPQIVQVKRCLQNQLYPPPVINIKAAANCFVVDRYGIKIPFPALYEEKKAILVFVRHFLCYTCREYVEDLAKIPQKYLEDAGVRLIVIGQSSHDHIQGFCALTGYTHEIYNDPTRKIYKSLQMKQGETFYQAGDKLHFGHLDLNRLDHAPINLLLQLAGVKTVDFSNEAEIINI